MKFSIVVPVYNVAEYLPACADSLLQQTGDFEILFVDDGSTDGISGALCDRYAAEHPDRVRALHKPNGGPGDARNYGIREAKGEYILFVDSDDYIAPDTLSTLEPYLADDLDVLIFGFRIDRDHAIGPPRLDPVPMNVPMTLESQPSLLRIFPNAWNKVWRRSVFLDNDIWFPTKVWYEDISITGKLFACAKSLLAIPDALYYYVVREGSITRNDMAERNREIITALDSVISWFSERGLYEQYREQLEALVVENVFLTTSVRVIRIDPKSPVLEELRRYTFKTFPDWTENPLVQQFPPRHRLLLFLLRHRCFRLVRLLFAVKGE